MFFVAQRASDRRRQESEDKLDTRANELADLIRTLPPEDFLSALGETYWRCDGVLATVRRAEGTLDNAELKEAIRAVLRAIASLAQKFDAAPWGAVYATNVMVFRPQQILRELSQEARSGILGRLRFRERSDL